jgi:16S rRNA (guanine527-N7)-methyltransferase
VDRSALGCAAQSLANKYWPDLCKKFLRDTTLLALPLPEKASTNHLRWYPVDPATISRLLEPYIQLDEPRLRLTSIYIDLLLKWNARMNLTAVRNPEEIVTRHFGESFFAADILRSQATVQHGIDLGSGAGFPGIPIAMSMPDARFVLIESQQKKATFLKEVIFTLGLQNITVFAGRGEDYPQQANLVTMRAVERFEKTLPIATELAGPDGCIALMIGATQAKEANQLAKDVKWQQPIPIPGGHSRILLAGTKEIKVG